MRWIKTLVIAAIFLIVIGAGVLWATGHQLGPRPTDTFAALPMSDDVKFIEANGLQFGYLEKGKGPLVLLFHGYPETARSWNEVQITIASAGFRTVAVFMRGYPPSDFADDYSVRALGDDILALIDALGETSAHIVGHDWGAIAVYQAATKAPEKIDSITALAIPHPLAIASDPRVILNAPHFLYYQSPFAPRLLWSHDFAHIDRIYEDWSPTYQVPQSELQDIKTSLKVPGAVEGALGYYWAFISADPQDGGPAPDSTIKVPALVIAGTADGAIESERFDAATPAFEGPYELEKLEGTGHFPHLEEPNIVASLITRFLTKLEPQP